MCRPIMLKASLTCFFFSFKKYGILTFKDVEITQYLKLLLF